jgi:hypothetical protein
LNGALFLTESRVTVLGAQVELSASLYEQTSDVEPASRSSVVKWLYQQAPSAKLFERRGGRAHRPAVSISDIDRDARLDEEAADVEMSSVGSLVQRSLKEMG